MKVLMILLFAGLLTVPVLSVIFDSEIIKFVQHTSIIIDLSCKNDTTKISTDKGGLFEMWYTIDYEKKIITRKYVRRLDQNEATLDNTEYKIIKSEKLIDSLDSAAVTVLMAVGCPGSGNIETIWMGNDFMYTSRNSGMFAMFISGVYKRKR